MKKLLSMFTTCIMLCVMLATPVSAAENTSILEKNIITANEEFSTYATNYFTGSTGKMNSLNAGQSRIFNASSGSIYGTSSVTKVTLNVTVSSGSSPFYIYVVNPDGYTASKLISRSGSVSFTEFNGTDAHGKWSIYIRSTGTVSTASANLRVEYSY